MASVGTYFKGLQYEGWSNFIYLGELIHNIKKNHTYRLVGGVTDQCYVYLEALL